MTTLDIAHQSRAHSKIVGGSTARRVMNCTASVLHNQKYPNTESSFAGEGTACHEAVDFILQGKVDEDEQVIGLVFNKILIDKKLFLDAIKPALEYYDKIDAELGGIDFFNEQTVQIPNIPDAFGTCDIIGYAEAANRTIVLDWKFGAGKPVTADFNEQMLYYALGAIHTSPTDKFFKKGRPVELFIAQPRSLEGEPFTRWMTSIEQIEAFGVDLKRAVDTALGPDATFEPGDWCQFCPGESGCPAKRGTALNGLEMGIDEIAKDLDPWLDRADEIIALGKAIKDRAHKAAELGGKFTNYKLVAKRADREFKDEETAKKALVKAGLKPADCYTKPKFISPAMAEAALKLTHGKTVALPLDPKGQPLFKQESTGSTLAPKTDNRPELMVMKEGLKKLAGRLASAGGLPLLKKPTSK